MFRKRTKLLAGASHRAASFRASERGNVAVIFAISSTVMVGAIGAGVDYAGSLKDKMAMQNALDSAALAAVKNGQSMTSAQLQTAVQQWFNAEYVETDTGTPTVGVSYNSTTQTATVTATASHPTSFLKVMGINSVSVNTSATAKMGAALWPICVQVTSPASNHTLGTQGTSAIKFNSCMVQVNTNNWDAVEARDTSYQLGTNGENCFVGDIHYGNVLPAKDPSCTLFPDPFNTMSIPAPAPCVAGNTNVIVKTAGTTLQPGTYCGGLAINASTTLAPGLYIINNGELDIYGTTTTVTANGVTFLFTGSLTTTVFDIDDGKLNITPMTTGEFAGFIFYVDPSIDINNCKDPGDGMGLKAPAVGPLESGKTPIPAIKAPAKGGGTCTSVVQDTGQINGSGIMYLQGESFLFQDTAQVNLTGALTADFINGQGSASMNMTGDTSTATSAEIAMKKQGTGVAPILVQ